MLKPVEYLVFRPFLSIEQPNIAILPLLQKVEDKLPDQFIVVLWNQCNYTKTLKRNTMIGYMKESDYIEKHMIEQSDHITEVIEISHENLPPMPDKLAFMFHHTFYAKPKIDLEDGTISQETQ